jgi:putative oxidoreductase
MVACNMAFVGRFLALKFLPVWPDLALLVLRVWFGGLLLLLHGLMKISMWSVMSQKFADPFGIGSPASLALSIFAEAVCATLIVAGAFTRFAAMVCIINMTTAFLIGHGGRLTGPQNGELAFLYLGAFITLLLAGPGRFSIDGRR